MSDTIDRAQAMTELQMSAKRLTLAYEAHGEGRVEYSDDVIRVSDASNILRALPSAQPEQRWIPCSERLPKVRKWVLCQCRAGIMDVLRLTEDGDWNKNYPHAEYMGGFVIAWMPLPEPYKEGE